MDRIINVKVGGNHLSKDNKNAGVKGEGNVTKLRITFDEGWDGYAKTVTFFDALGGNPVKRLLTVDLIEDTVNDTRTYITPIPQEPLAIAGELTFVIDGFYGEFVENESGDYEIANADKSKRQRSIADTLIVKDAPETDNATEPTDPTPTEPEQWQSQVDKIIGDIQGAVEAKEAIENMSVSAETLETDVPAFVKKTEQNGIINLHYGLPKGNTGLSAYEIAVKNGYKGTEAEWNREVNASREAAEQSAKNAEASATKAETATTRNPIIVDGYWHVWDATAEQYVDTGVKAQSGSTVYYGDNPPEDADVWIDLEGESAIYAPYVGENGNWYTFNHQTQTFTDSGYKAVPERGVDFWTREDVAEIKTYVDDEVSNKEDKSNKITEITEGSTNEQYPSAKAVYNKILELISASDRVIFTPSVSGNGDLSWTNDGGLDNPETVNIKGIKGDTGYSPTLRMTELDDGYEVFLKDAEGEKSFVLTNGVSPNLNVTEVTNGYEVSLTDKNGTETFFVPRSGVVGGVTADGGEIFNSYAKNQAINLNSHAEGSGTIAGVKGYYIADISEDKKHVTLSLRQGVIPEDSFDTGYQVGDIVSVRNGWGNYLCDYTTIESIENNVVTLADELPFAKPSLQEEADDAFFVRTKPNPSDIAVQFGWMSHAEGDTTLAGNWAAHAEGKETVASGVHSHAEGHGSLAGGYAAHAENVWTKAMGFGSHAEGNGSIASGAQAHAEGRQTTASALAAHAEGYNSHAKGGQSHAEGMGTEASGSQAHAEGSSTKACGSYSHTEGYATKATGSASHAEGVSTVAGSDNQHVEGRHNIEDTKGVYAHIVGNGYSNLKSNAYTLDWNGNGWFAGDVKVGSGKAKLVTEPELKEVENKINEAESKLEQAEIRINSKIASEKGSDVGQPTEGGGEIFNNYGSNTASSHSHAEGYDTHAEGHRSHTEGYGTQARGSSSHAEGHASRAFGAEAHAEGTSTEANGQGSHTEGSHTITKEGAAHSHAEGHQTIAAAPYQHVEGQFNEIDEEGKYAHIVGWGNTSVGRKNIYTLSTTGDGWFSGSVEAKGIILASSTSGSNKKFRLTVDDLGTLAIEEI